MWNYTSGYRCVGTAKHYTTAIAVNGTITAPVKFGYVLGKGTPGYL